MTLHDTERWESVRGSVEKYAKDKLVTDEGLTVDLYDGAKFDPSSADAWVEVRTMELAPAASFRHVGADQRGEDARVLIQVDVKVKVEQIVSGLSGNIRRVDEILDTVHDHFKTGREIPVYQLQSGGNPATQVATLFVMEGQKQDLGEREDDRLGQLLQWRVYEATCRYDKTMDLS